MKQAYPALIAEYKGDFLVYVPDMDIYTEGKSMADAIEMARDAIGLKGIDYEDDGKEIPDPSTADMAMEKAKEDTEVFDYSTGVVTFVDIDFFSIPQADGEQNRKAECYASKLAEYGGGEAHINVSRVLQGGIDGKIECITMRDAEFIAE